MHVYCSLFPCFLFTFGLIVALHSAQSHLLLPLTTTTESLIHQRSSSSVGYLQVKPWYRVTNPSWPRRLEWETHGASYFFSFLFFSFILPLRIYCSFYSLPPPWPFSAVGCSQDVFPLSRSPCQGWPFLPILPIHPAAFYFLFLGGPGIVLVCLHDI